MAPNEHSKLKNKSKAQGYKGLRLGELLRRRRKELKLSFEDIERDTHIRRKYLRLIEKGDYSALPNDVYSRGYIKNFSEHLGFDTKEILRIYSQERNEYSQQNSINEAQPRSLKPIDTPTYTFSPRSILVILTAVFVLIMVGYVGLQLSQLSAPPIISLTNQEKSQVNTSFVVISGEVDGGSDVFINGSPVLTSPDGSFSERVTLVEGSNQITITAKNKFGRESTKTIIVESRSGSGQKAQAELKNDKFDGVEVLISIGEQAAFVSVEVDGQNEFRGTMLPGTSQLFSAKNQIKLSTSNAGTTKVKYSNSVLAAQDIAELGREGEPLQDLIFSKDTEIK